jgi:hypothetical protein
MVKRKAGPTQALHFQAESSRYRALARSGRITTFLVVSIVAVLGGSYSASASVVPGTPVPVEPGIPGSGRAWELVTPPDTVAAEVLLASVIEASGNALVYRTAGPLPGSSPDAGVFLANIAHRTTDGWSTSPLTPPYPEAEEFFSSAGPETFNPDLSEAIWTANPPLAEPGAPQGLGLFRGTNDGSFSLLAAPIGISPAAFGAASTDLQHVLFETEEHLLPGDAARISGNSLYEVNGSSLRLVDVDDNGLLLSDCGSTIPEENPISRDGQRIFFMTHPSCSGPARAYVRENGLSTTMIAASQCTLADCGPEADATIAGVTPSGSSAFIVTGQKLTNDDVDDSADLYRYDVADGQLILLSAALGPGLLVAEKESPVQASEDGSRALFWAEDPSVEGSKYLYLATSGGLRLIAPSAGDFVQWSTDGRYALFTTQAQLVAGDSDESVDVYRFDADAETLTRISTGSGGGNGPFDTKITTDAGLGEDPNHRYRAMSSDGGDIFFGTAERLVPEDRNEVADVYEWRDGSLSLVSPGSGDRPSIYLGATPDGRSAFFRTTLTLLPLDRDGGDTDFYVARVGGGFPEPMPPATCQDESCLPPLNGQANRSEPASAAARAGAIRIKRPSPEARRRIASTGKIVLLAEVPSAGRLTARARARIGHGRRLVASTSLKVALPGPVRLAMPLSNGARQALAGGHSVHLQVVLRLSRSHAARRIEFVLGGGG